MNAQAATAPPPVEHESPLEHVVQHPLLEVPARVTPFTPNGTITVFSDQIAMLAVAGILLIAPVPALVRRRKGASGVDERVAAEPATLVEAVRDALLK